MHVLWYPPEEIDALLISVGLTPVKTTKVWESKGENESAKSGWRIQSCCYLRYIHTRKFIYSCPWFFRWRCYFGQISLQWLCFCTCVQKGRVYFCRRWGYFPVQSTDPLKKCQKANAAYIQVRLNIERDVQWCIVHTYKSGWTLRGMSNGALFSPKLRWQCPWCTGLS